MTNYENEKTFSSMYLNDVYPLEPTPKAPTVEGDPTEKYYERGLNSSTACHSGIHKNCIMHYCSCACHKGEVIRAPKAVEPQVDAHLECDRCHQHIVKVTLSNTNTGYLHKVGFDWDLAMKFGCFDNPIPTSPSSAVVKPAIEFCNREDCDSNHMCFQEKGHPGPCFQQAVVKPVKETISAELKSVLNSAKEEVAKWEPWQRTDNDPLGKPEPVEEVELETSLVRDEHLSEIVLLSGRDGSSFCGIGSPDDEYKMAIELIAYRKLAAAKGAKRCQ